MENILLFEIGTEEIPAKFMATTLEQLKNHAENRLHENRIQFGKIECLGTPRRLSLMIYDIAQSQTELQEKVKGPSRKVAYQHSGEPTKALLGFLKGNEGKLEEVFFESIKDVEYVFFNKFEKGKSTHSILEKLLPEILFSINFPKSMRWRDYSIRFARPIRWLVSMLNDEVIHFSVEGLKSSNITQGHRTLSNESLCIDHAKNYRKILRDHHVLVDQQEREDLIIQGIQKIEEKIGAKVLVDQDLLHEVVFLVEYPTPFYASFEEEFLELPKEAIITPMKDHQRYFPVVQEDVLLPYFVAVRNGDDTSLDTVKNGNERVLRARLKDAQFFYNEDLKEKLETKVEKLKTIVYQVKLGTIYDKVLRIQEISKVIGVKLGLSDLDLKRLHRATTLCKADLVTGMVNEFDELQGIMGREYALKNGEEVEVANSIYGHYLPRFSGDDLPKDTLSMIMSIADKLDSIVGSFGIGVVPTGSQDPFGLRRQAIGILNIILKNSLKFDLGDLFQTAIHSLKDKINREEEDLKNDLEQFFKQRLKVLLIEDGFQYDLVDAVLDANLQDIFSAKEKLEALSRLTNTEEFKSLVTGLTRGYSLSKKAEPITMMISKKLFETEQEHGLFEVFESVQKEVRNCMENRDFGGAFQLFNRLTKPIHDFFEHVMVMVEDLEVRNNRLALLKNIEELSKSICNFEKIK
jgi:glycyl-tRNA synthetase beta chain